MKNKISTLAAAALFSLAAISANAATTYTFSLLDALGGGSRTLTANRINDSGQIVGYSQNIDGSERATLWSSDNYASPQELGNSGSILSSRALGINNSGNIVGWSKSISNIDSANFWSINDFTATQLPSSTSNVRAAVINDSNQIVGVSSGSLVLWSDPTSSPVVGNSGVPQEINNSGNVVGQSQGNPYVWNINSSQSRPLVNFDGGYSTGVALGINNSGNIVGYLDVQPTPSDTLYTQAAFWGNGSALPFALESLGGATKSGRATAVNDLQQVVGRSLDANNVQKATLWDGANVIDLNTYLDSATVDAGWMLTSASDINNNGWIIGTARNSISGLSKGYLLQSVSQVPEADTSAMLLTGLGVVGFMARRRKNIQA